MKIDFKKIAIVLCMLGFSGLTWFWMLGGLAVPEQVAAGSNMLSSWANPGVMPFPAAVSIIIALQLFFGL